MVIRINEYRLFMLMAALLALAWVTFLLIAGLISIKKHKVSDSYFFLQNRTNWLRTKNKVVDLARAVHKARVHVRGTKTSDYLHTALHELDFILDAFDVDKRTIFKRPVRKSRNVCPEIYMGSKYGRPLFDKGFEEIECDYGKPIQDLVTVVAIDDGAGSGSSMSSVRLIKSILDIYGNISVILHTRRKAEFVDMFRYCPSLSLVESYSDKVGTQLNQIISKVLTPYVLIAKDMDFITTDSRIKRLVREIERMDVAVAGGAWRDPTGHWTHGCYQTAYRNSTLTYVYGYDESLHECLFCDHLTGPFVAKTEILTKNTFRPYDISDGLFEEWFLRIRFLKAEAISCPDSMFHVKERNIQNNFEMFMSYFRIYKLIDVNGRTVIGNCPELKPRLKQKTVHPCASNENSRVVKFIMRVCNYSNSVCELQDGTNLGAIKFGKVLPWERDGDIGFLNDNFTRLSKLKTLFEKENYSFEIVNFTKYSEEGPRIDVYAPGWRIELVGRRLLDSHTLLDKAINPTKALLDGQCVNVPRNPGLVARNRYGREIYQHALHYIDTDTKDEWEPYRPTKFPPCGPYKLFYKTNHDCLDRYNNDGSLQFMYLLP